MPVDDDQRGIGADAAQIDRIAINDVARAARLAARSFRNAQIEHLRQILNGLLQGHAAGLGDIGIAHRHHRRTDRSNPAHPAAGHDDVGVSVSLRGCRSCRGTLSRALILGMGHRRDQGQRQSGTHQGCGPKRGYVHDYPPACNACTRRWTARG
jgi:hypothetical protein